MTQQHDFSKGSVARNILYLAAPMTAAQLINVLYSVVDRMYLGRLPGHLALTGVGLTLPVVSIIMGFANLCGTGGAPLCSICRGRGDDEEAERIMGNSFTLLLLFGAAVTVVFLAFQRPILYLFGASDATYPYASAYMTIYLLGSIFVMIGLGMNPFISMQGFGRTGMMTVGLGALVNIVLDPVFIFAFHMGVRGAAVATILSQLLSAVWVLRFLTGQKAELTMHFHGFRPDFGCIRKITLLGTASFVMSFTDCLVQVACNATLRQFGGDIYISVMTVINSVRQIAQTPVMAISDGASPVISYNYGAHAFARVREAIRFMTQLAFGYTMLIWGLVSAFPMFFIKIFNHETELLTLAVPALHIYFFGFVMMAFQFSGQCVFKSLNKPRLAIFFSLLRKAVIVVPLTLWLPHVGGLGVNGVFIAEPISNLIGGLLCYVTMRITVMPELKQDEA